MLEDAKPSIAGSVVRCAETHPSDDAEPAEVIGLVHGEATSTAA
ncbi:hypothetical protein [Streptomyces acidiscabies]